MLRGKMGGVAESLQRAFFQCCAHSSILCHRSAHIKYCSPPLKPTELIGVHLAKIGAVDDARARLQRIDLLDGHAATQRDVLDRFGVRRDDADRFGDGLGGDRMVARNHDDFDARRSALGDGVRHGGARRIDHTHEADKAKPLDGKVDVLDVEFVAARKLGSVEAIIAKAEHTLAHAAELEIGAVEVVAQLKAIVARQRAFEVAAHAPCRQVRPRCRRGASLCSDRERVRLKLQFEVEKFARARAAQNLRAPFMTSK